MDITPAPPTRSLVLPIVESPGDLTDARLTQLLAEVGEAKRSVDALAITLAGEVARRSDRSLGHAGLAARTGDRSAEKLIQRHTGVSFSEAKNLTKASGALDGGASWLAPVAAGIRDGALTAAGAAAITSGLGAPTSTVSASELTSAASSLVDIARQTTPEETVRAARLVRDHLDADGVTDRESHLRAKRSLRVIPLPDGTTKVILVLDPESAAIVTTALSTAVSPRRSGPRFLDSAAAASEIAASEPAIADSRSPEQRDLDAFVDIVQLAVRAAGSALDPTRVFGGVNPGIRIHVTAEALEAGAGAAHLEGQTAAVSVATAIRSICTSGYLPVLFDGTRAIDVGRTQRLHSPRQRIALAAQWGGCAWTGCDRPPSLTEVHHIDRWNGRNTTLANGIPLCRFHHVELHTNGWQITTRHEGPEPPTVWLTPPLAADPHRRPRQLHSRTPCDRAPDADLHGNLSARARCWYCRSG